jgi:hypothetical protein
LEGEFGKTYGCRRRVGMRERRGFKAQVRQWGDYGSLVSYRCGDDDRDEGQLITKVWSERDDRGVEGVEVAATNGGGTADT